MSSSYLREKTANRDKVHKKGSATKRKNRRKMVLISKRINRYKRR